jgi:hypothetical protein
VQRVFQHPLSLTLSWRDAPKVVCELVFSDLVVLRKRLAHSEGSETAMMEQDSADLA